MANLGGPDHVGRPQSESDDFGINTMPLTVKIHYSFGAEIHLARHPQVLNLRTFPVDDRNTIGLVDLATCLRAVTKGSPELLGSSFVDYSVYVWDYTEPDTPLVGHGMLSCFTDPGETSAQEAVVSGLITRNPVRIFIPGRSQDSLEVRIKLSPVSRPNACATDSSSQLGCGTDADWGSFARSSPFVGYHQSLPPTSRVQSPAVFPASIAAPVPRRPQDAGAALFPTSAAQSPEPLPLPALPNTELAAGDSRRRPQPADAPVAAAAAATAPTPGSNPPSRPASRSSRSRRPTGRPRGRPRKRCATPSDHTSGCEEATDADADADEAPPRKRRAVVTSAVADEAAFSSAFTADPESLRVAASTSGSIRNMRPVGVNADSDGATHLREPPRAPTPIPGVRRRTSVKPRGGSKLRGRTPPTDPVASSDPAAPPDLAAAAPFSTPTPTPMPSSAAHYSSYQTGASIFSPPDEPRSPLPPQAPTPPHPEYTDRYISSSPPVARNSRFMRSSPPPSSPTLPYMPVQVTYVDSGFMSGGVEDLYDDVTMSETPMSEMPVFDLSMSEAHMSEATLREAPFPAEPAPMPEPRPLAKTAKAKAKLKVPVQVFKFSAGENMVPVKGPGSEWWEQPPPPPPPSSSSSSSWPPPIDSTALLPVNGGIFRTLAPGPPPPPSHAESSGSPSNSTTSDGGHAPATGFPALSPPTVDRSPSEPTYQVPPPACSGYAPLPPHLAPPAFVPTPPFATPIQTAPAAPTAEPPAHGSPGNDRFTPSPNADGSDAPSLTRSTSMPASVRGLSAPASALPSVELDDAPQALQTPSQALQTPPQVPQADPPPPSTTPRAPVRSLSMPVPSENPTTTALPSQGEPERAAQAPPVGIDLPPAAAPSQPDSMMRLASDAPPPPNMNKNYLKKQSIKVKLREAIDAGIMPAFCSTCGAIETPTWRKLWYQDYYGPPPPFLCAGEKPGGVILVEVLEHDANGNPAAYRLIKKNLAPGDDKQFWSAQLLCNPCGIYLTKFNKHRPRDHWDKDKARIGRDRPKPRKRRGRADSDLASESGPVTDPPDPPPPAEVQANSRPENTAGSSGSSAGSARSRRTAGAGTVDSPIALDCEDLGTACRALFPSQPRRDSSPVALGETAINAVQAALGLDLGPGPGGRPAKPGGRDSGKENVAAVAAFMRDVDSAGNSDGGDDDLYSLFRSPVAERLATPLRPTTRAPDDDGDDDLHSLFISPAVEHPATPPHPSNGNAQQDGQREACAPTPGSRNAQNSDRKEPAAMQSTRTPPKDGQQEPFTIPPRPITPPPPANARDDGQQDPFKTPTRPTPSHRPITRSISKTLQRSGGEAGSAALLTLHLTPSKNPRTPRSKAAQLIEGERLTPTRRYSPRNGGGGGGSSSSSSSSIKKTKRSHVWDDPSHDPRYEYNSLCEPISGPVMSEEEIQQLLKTLDELPGLSPTPSSKPDIYSFNYTGSATWGNWSAMGDGNAGANRQSPRKDDNDFF